MNLKFLCFALVSGLAAAHPPPHPNCTIGNDTQACNLPDGSEGVFLCHPHPDHDDHHHHHGGIVGGFHHVVDRIMGHHPSHDERDHKSRGHGHHHGHGGKPCHKDKDGSRHLLRSGSSSSSSSSRSGFHHHHGMMGGMMGGRHGHHHDGMGPHGHGPPGILSSTHCVPVDGPPKDHPPFHPPHHHPHEPPTCGCCGDVCPAQLDCGCTCDLTDWEGKVAKGVWVEVTLRDETTKAKKCVPTGAYADANRVQCVTDCTVDMVEEDIEDAIDLEEEFFGEEEMEEKESRD